MAHGDYGPTPQTIREGVMYGESEFIGNASRITVEPDHPERVKKGDLGMANIPDFEPRSSFESPGSPFKLTGGR